MQRMIPKLKPGMKVFYIRRGIPHTGIITNFMGSDNVELNKLTFIDPIDTDYAIVHKSDIDVGPLVDKLELIQYPTASQIISIMKIISCNLFIKQGVYEDYEIFYRIYQEWYESEKKMVYNAK